MKCKLISSVIASAILTLSGCSSVDSTSLTDVNDTNDILVIQKGASLQTATTVLANLYGVKTVKWDRKIDRGDYRLQHDVTINKLNSAQTAIDSVYKVIPQLYANVDNQNNQINVSLNDIKFASGDYVNKTGFDTTFVKDNANIVHVTQHQVSKNNKDVRNSTVAIDTSIKTNNNPAQLMTGAESLTKTMPVIESHKLVNVEKGTMLSRSLMRDFSQRDYKLVWSVDEKVADIIHQPLTKSVALDTSTIDDLARSSSEVLSDLSKENVQVKIFEQTKQAVVYVGEKGNVSLFNTVEGRLSDNVKRLAAQFGWSLNTNYGWLANNDYVINVPFPVVSKNNINSALSKLLVPYDAKITHKLLESNKQVFIVDAK